MDEIAGEIDALSLPVRAQLFDNLAGLRRKGTTDELADLLDRHPNGIRLHLEVLADAGYVLREKERRGRGRPRDLWSINPEALPAGARPTAYAELSRWLARAMVGPVENADEIEARGREIGLDLASDDSGDLDPESRFHDVLAAMGFQPSRERKPEAPDGITYCLNNCPYRDAVRERQQVICSLHRGITKGMLEKVSPSSRLSGFVVKDPDDAGCLVEVEGPLAAT